ncbi:MAG: DUF4388 domain-containing protein [Alphaproteobacteria bacterium]|nr:DUF4388 domain-containing protein [Alphaproteobacteria bacterium]
MNAARPVPPVRGGVEVLSAVAPRVTLATVLQVADLEAVSGWIDVGGEGGVALVDGMVVDAWCGPWRAEDALFELFLAGGEVRIVLREAAVPDARPLGATSSLVLEGTRRADEWTRIGGMVLSLSARATMAAVPGRCEAVVDLLDGESPLFEVVAVAGLPRHVAAHGLAPLVSSGTLVGSGAVVPVPVAAVPRAPDTGDEHHEDDVDAPDFFDCLDRGRQALRGGDLAGSLRWFDRAVTLRPEDRVAAQNQRRVARLLQEQA